MFRFYPFSFSSHDPILLFSFNLKSDETNSEKISSKIRWWKFCVFDCVRLHFLILVAKNREARGNIFHLDSFFVRLLRLSGNVSDARKLRLQFLRSRFTSDTRGTCKCNPQSLRNPWEGIKADTKSSQNIYPHNAAVVFTSSQISAHANLLPA